jgi:hypothetical protein
MDCAGCHNPLSTAPPEFFFTDPAFYGFDFIDWCEHCRILHIANREPYMFGGGGDKLDLFTSKLP